MLLYVSIQNDCRRVRHDQYYLMLLSLRPRNSIFSYWGSYIHWENNQQILPESDLGSIVALAPRTYHTSPSQRFRSQKSQLLYTHFGQTRKNTFTIISQTSRNREDRLQYEPFCKTYFPRLEPQRDIFRCYEVSSDRIIFLNCLILNGSLYILCIQIAKILSTRRDNLIYFIWKIKPSKNSIIKRLVQSSYIINISGRRE